MQTNVLERVRALEADIEKCVDSIVQQELFATSITNERHRILLDHFTVQQATIVKDTAEKLLDAYLDEDDLVELRDAPAETADDIAAAVKEFEARIADIREYHHTYRDLPPIKNDLNTPNPKMLNDIFLPNEHFGACLDIDAHYARYRDFMVHTKTIAESCAAGDVGPELAAALPPLKSSSIVKWAPLWPGRVDFFRFAKALPEILLHETEAHRKLVAFALYQSFVDELLAYLVDFYHRVNPLKQGALERLLAEVESDGEEYWAALVAAKAEVSSVAAAAAAAAATNSGDEDDKDDEEEEGNMNKEESGAEAVVEDAEALRRRKTMAKLSIEGKVSCGLTIPPSLRRHSKNFSLWPVTMMEKLVSGLASAPAGATAGASEGTRAEGSARPSSSQYPRSLAEVKAVCLTEAKAAALLRSLLYTALETTDKRLLRDYSRTMEELEGDRAQAEDEFLASLEEVKKNSARTMEGTVAHAAQYNMQLAMRDARGGPLHGRNRRGRGAPHVAAPPPEPEPEKDLEEQELLGENGEPIPRWLARMHQLDKIFKCDVCGGTVYKGPKVFRDHFGADRHAEGLRRLGVTQHLKSFEGITSIREVVELRDKLSASESGFRKRLRENVDHEEIQDARGRVLSGKAYERRQNSRRDGRH